MVFQTFWLSWSCRQCLFLRQSRLDVSRLSWDLNWLRMNMKMLNRWWTENEQFVGPQFPSAMGADVRWARHSSILLSLLHDLMHICISWKCHATSNLAMVCHPWPATFAESSRFYALMFSSGQSIVNEVLAKKPKRRVEWVPFTHYLGLFGRLMLETLRTTAKPSKLRTLLVINVASVSPWICFLWKLHSSVLKVASMRVSVCLLFKLVLQN